MRIILIDKKYGEFKESEEDLDYVKQWKRHLEERGHSIVACKTLSDLDDKQRDLGNYDIAICHPEFGSKDPKILIGERKVRPGFKIVINSGFIKEHKDVLKVDESPQLCYRMLSRSQEVAELVENGW